VKAKDVYRYAPGLHRTEEIRAVCKAVSKPVNVLAVPGLSFADITETCERLRCPDVGRCCGDCPGGNRDPRQR
jgi:hypothetical protein